MSLLVLLIWWKPDAFSSTRHHQHRTAETEMCVRIPSWLGTHAGCNRRRNEDTRCLSSRGHKVALTWNVKQVKPEAEVIKNAQQNIKFILRLLLGICHLKHAELAKHIHKCQGRVVLQKDEGKDDHGFQAVLTEQGASPMATMSALPGMAGEANDAVSACTQVRMEDGHHLQRGPSSDTVVSARL